MKKIFIATVLGTLLSGCNGGSGTGNPFELVTQVANNQELVQVVREPSRENHPAAIRPDGELLGTVTVTVTDVLPFTSPGLQGGDSATVQPQSEPVPEISNPVPQLPSQEPESEPVSQEPGLPLIPWQEHSFLNSTWFCQYDTGPKAGGILQLFVKLSGDSGAPFSDLYPTNNPDIFALRLFNHSAETCSVSMLGEWGSTESNDSINIFSYGTREVSRLNFDWQNQTMNSTDGKYQCRLYQSTDPDVSACAVP